MWRTAETNTHQDHVIAHVIGATPVGHFVWDETAYLLLDIGFIWKVYLDGEMGLLPGTVALDELRADMNQMGLEDFEKLTRPVPVARPSPIESVEFFETDDSRRLVLNCESGGIVLEMSFLTREISVEFKE
ncbi:MAG TPA: hypothetical protein VFI57_14290 [Pyrinomonadaceae bacterium]|nr:hypothetical protein [Pyrinomonadaceae bacterium]